MPHSPYQLSWVHPALAPSNAGQFVCQCNWVQNLRSSLYTGRSSPEGLWSSPMYCFDFWLVVYLPTPLKNVSSSVGMILPNIWKVIKAMFQTTNQIWFVGSSNESSTGSAVFNTAQLTSDPRCENPLPGDMRCMRWHLLPKSSHLVGGAMCPSWKMMEFVNGFRMTSHIWNEIHKIHVPKQPVIFGCWKSINLPNWLNYQRVSILELHGHTGTGSNPQQRPLLVSTFGGPSMHRWTCIA